MKWRGDMVILSGTITFRYDHEVPPPSQQRNRVYAGRGIVQYGPGGTAEQLVSADLVVSEHA